MSDNPKLVTAGDTVEAAEENRRSTRIVFRFIDATDRDTFLPTPVAGQLAWLTTPGIIQYYDGSTWVQVATISDVQARLVRAGDTWTGKHTQQTSGYTLLDAEFAVRGMFIGAQPAQAVQGQLWLDTLDAIGDNSGDPVLRRWSGSAWTPLLKGRA